MPRLGAGLRGNECLSSLLLLNNPYFRPSKALISDFAQARTAEVKFGYNMLLHKALNLLHEQLIGEAPFEFMEKPDEQSLAIEPGFEQFLKDTSLSGDAAVEEIGFLKMLKFK